MMKDPTGENHARRDVFLGEIGRGYTSIPDYLGEFVTEIVRVESVLELMDKLGEKHVTGECRKLRRRKRGLG